jgi:hypothetical protein
MAVPSADCERAAARDECSCRDGRNASTPGDGDASRWCRLPTAYRRRSRGAFFQTPDNPSRCSTMCVGSRSRTRHTGSGFPFYGASEHTVEGTRSKAGLAVVPYDAAHQRLSTNKRKAPSHRRRRFLHPPTSACYPSIEAWLDHRRECVAGTVQTRLHSSEVAVGDFGNLLVRLALELPKHKHLPMMLGELSHGLLDQFP